MRNEIDSRYYADEIRMWIPARKKNSVAIVVESKSDERFFKKFFQHSPAFFPVDGFKNVIDVINDIENGISGVIGIIDADFRHIDNEDISLDNIFLTDYHDIEMMMVDSPAWDNVVSFHSDNDKLLNFQTKNSKLVKEYILELAKPISSIRFLNYKKNLGLKFKTQSKDKYNFIDYSKFIDKDTLKINNNKLNETIENKSLKQNYFKNNPDILNELTEISKIEYDLLNFCNGHDVINILSIALKRVIGNKDISSQDIEMQLIIAYRFDDFQKTNLYKFLTNWEKNNSDFKLFC